MLFTGNPPMPFVREFQSACRSSKHVDLSNPVCLYSDHCHTVNQLLNTTDDQSRTYAQLTTQPRTLLIGFVTVSPTIFRETTPFSLFKYERRSPPRRHCLEKSTRSSVKGPPLNKNLGFGIVTFPHASQHSKHDSVGTRLITCVNAYVGY